MALKADRQINAYEIQFHLPDISERGVIVSFSGSTSGVNPDSTDNTVHVPASPSGMVPVGMLLADVVSLDLSKYARNVYKNEQVSGEKVPLATKGWLVTDKIYGTPAIGGTAYLGYSGYLSPTSTDGNESDEGNAVVGKFLSTLDENNYARVAIDL